MEVEKAYIGRANVIRRVLLADGEELSEFQQQGITRVQVRLRNICLDTNNVSDPITYNDGVIELQIGLIPDIQPGNYTARVTVYDNPNPEGKAWDQFPVEVMYWEVC